MSSDQIISQDEADAPDHRLPRFFIDWPIDQVENDSISIDDAELKHQIEKVLSLKAAPNNQEPPRAQLVLLPGDGRMWTARLSPNMSSRCKSTSIAFELLEHFQEESANPARFVSRIYMPLIKPARFEMALEKLTELGVDEIVPTQYERSQYKAENYRKRIDRWSAICREAAEQSRRVRLPIIHQASTWQQALDDAVSDRGLMILLHERANAPDMVSLLCNRQPVEQNRLHIFLGPEGGITDAESSSFIDKGAKLARLGDNILRAETAAVVALSAVTFAANKIQD